MNVFTEFRTKRHLSRMRFEVFFVAVTFQAFQKICPCVQFRDVPCFVCMLLHKMSVASSCNFLVLYCAGKCVLSCIVLIPFILDCVALRFLLNSKTAHEGQWSETGALSEKVLAGVASATGESSHGARASWWEWDNKLANWQKRAPGRSAWRWRGTQRPKDVDFLSIFKLWLNQSRAKNGVYRGRIS